MTLKEVSIITDTSFVKRKVKGIFQIHLERVEVKDRSLLIGAYGVGRTIRATKRDYAKQLCGKKIIVAAMLPERREYQLPPKVTE